MFKNALVSTSNKDGLLEFLKPLVAQGLRVVSTGGTSKYLRENGIPVVEVAEQTGFPEVMDGRVRTLHPSIHMPLLARANVAEDMQLLKANGLAPFDLVIVNLYPFEEASKKDLPEDELIEFIDIGGPSLLRAASKNFERIAVVCDPADYTWLAEKKELTRDERKRLAAKVFAHTSRYDALIAKTLEFDSAPDDLLSGTLVQELRYGENPQQTASWYSSQTYGLHTARILHGKPLSYNNILDLEAACATVREFEAPCAVAVKHTNPCGVGQGKNIEAATTRALLADPVSVFGGIIAINREVDVSSAQALSALFLECVIAPSFSVDALEILKKKKDLRLLEWSELGSPPLGTDKLYRTVSGGFLVQSSDNVQAWPKNPEWMILGESPSQAIRDDLSLAWKVCAHLKSNAIAIACEGTTVGLGMGQVNRVDAVEQALARMAKHHPNVKNAVLASDAFFPFPDSIEVLAAAGIRWVIQPGGSIRDEAVFSKAKELGVNLVITKTRHFKH